MEPRCAASFPAGGGCFNLWAALWISGAALACTATHKDSCFYFFLPPFFFSFFFVLVRAIGMIRQWSTTRAGNFSLNEYVMSFGSAETKKNNPGNLTIFASTWTFFDRLAWKWTKQPNKRSLQSKTAEFRCLFGFLRLFLVGLLMIDMPTKFHVVKWNWLCALKKQNKTVRR